MNIPPVLTGQVIEQNGRILVRGQYVIDGGTRQNPGWSWYDIYDSRNGSRKLASVDEALAHLASFLDGSPFTRFQE